MTTIAARLTRAFALRHPLVSAPMAFAGARVGVGFITWSLRKSPSLLADVLVHRPAAVMLSFGDPRPFADEIRAAGAHFVCQCQEMAHVMDAVEVKADVVVAQGAEADGHGALRGTLAFVPEVADYLAEHAPETLLLTAGVIRSIEPAGEIVERMVSEAAQQLARHAGSTAATA